MSSEGRVLDLETERMLEHDVRLVIDGIRIEKSSPISVATTYRDPDAHADGRIEVTFTAESLVDALWAAIGDGASDDVPIKAWPMDMEIETRCDARIEERESL